jgi:predicted phage terminase large subunit-like protein
MAEVSAVAPLEELSEGEIRHAMGRLTDAERQVLAGDWPSWAHGGQVPPNHAWRVWVLLAGRGFGKTRAGAEWISAFAREHPDAAVALVGATVDEARAVMVEGRSGLLAVARRGEREAMRWEPSRRRLVFASGAQAFLYSAANPESLRGPEHHIAWCDELAKWRGGKSAWDNLRLGLRLGERPRALVTTTPKPVPVLTSILELEGTVLTGGATRGNPHLPDDFIEAVEAAHKGTRFGRQELEGVLIADVEGALWSRELIEAARAAGPLHHAAHGPPPRAGEDLTRVVVGVDPPGSVEGACGIVVCGLGADGVIYVLADCSVARERPEGWARAVARAAEAWEADRVIAEKNNGGDMVESVLRQAGEMLPVRLVSASKGKRARAEPVAARFEAGKAKLAGCFPELEDELAGFTAEGWSGSGSSPDRADAMVWAMSELMRPLREPRMLML